MLINLSYNMNFTDYITKTICVNRFDQRVIIWRCGSYSVNIFVIFDF